MPATESKIDRCSIDGAKSLAATITRYWLRRGADGVRCWVEPAGEFWVVRGNLVAGLPPGAPAAMAIVVAAERRDRELLCGERPLRSAPTWLSYLGSSLARFA